MSGKIDFRLLLITDRKLVKKGTLKSVLNSAFKSGVKAIQIREKDLHGKDLLELASSIVKTAKKYKSKVLINDRIDIAVAAEANGVHLPVTGFSVKTARKFLKNKITGKSVHSLKEARQAERNGCDYILFGPIYKTPAKVKYGSPMGLKKLKQICKIVRIPVFAVGGINPSRAAKCIKAGAHGVAVIREIMCSESVNETIREFKKALGAL